MRNRSYAVELSLFQQLLLTLGVIAFVLVLAWVQSACRRLG